MMKKFPRETLDARAQRLLPFCQIVRPEGQGPFPTVFLFHGCGDPDGPQPGYAKAAAAKGIASVVVDSYRPRGISLIEARMLICSGMRLWGRERAGDLISLMHWARSQHWVQADRLAAAGWSHGGWGIMEALSCDRDLPGAMGLVDAEAVSLDGVKATYLAYPYVGIAALNRMRPWRHCPRTLAVIAAKDHLTTVRNAERVLDGVRASGTDVETWVVDATHAFDEPMTAPPMRFDEGLSQQAQERFGSLLDAAAPPVVTRRRRRA
jgi:dienelactone hydrolase